MFRRLLKSLTCDLNPKEQAELRSLRNEGVTFTFLARLRYLYQMDPTPARIDYLAWVLHVEPRTIQSYLERKP